MKLLVEGVCKRLGGKTVLDGVDLASDRPEVVAILGENGSGKSTLLRILAGVLDADRGRVLIDDRPIEADGHAARRRLGYVPEAVDALPHLTAGELIALVTSLKRAAPPPPPLIERLHVGPLLTQRMGSLSLGQRRRVGLVVALVGAPELLLLDEPTNGLDPDGLVLLSSLLAEQQRAGTAVLVATHDLALVEQLAARALRLEGGRLADADGV